MNRSSFSVRLKEEMKVGEAPNSRRVAATVIAMRNAMIYYFLRLRIKTKPRQ